MHRRKSKLRKGRKGALVISKEQAVALEHVRDYCRIERLARYMNGKGTPSHPLIVKVIKELSKEQIIEGLFTGYQIKES